MEIEFDFPPNYDKIQKKFNLKEHQPILFCYGDIIYNPMKVKVSPPLLAHETVHSLQQGKRPQDWWARYINDASFRFDQELEAHVAEYLRACDFAYNRHDRQVIMRQISEKLSSGLYGKLVRRKVAQEQIKKKLMEGNKVEE